MAAISGRPRETWDDGARRIESMERSGFECNAEGFIRTSHRPFRAQLIS